MEICNDGILVMRLPLYTSFPSLFTNTPTESVSSWALGSLGAQMDPHNWPKLYIWGSNSPIIFLDQSFRIISNQYVKHVLSVSECINLPSHLLVGKPPAAAERPAPPERAAARRRLAPAWHELIFLSLSALLNWSWREQTPNHPSFLRYHDI